MVTKRIHSRAPTRIDLAGGTLDIWPLYLFLNHPLTLNLGIDLFAEATIEETPAPLPGSPDSPKFKGIRLISKDQNAELRFSWDELKQNAIQAPPALELHCRLLKFFYDQKEKLSPRKSNSNTEFTLTTQARSPAGAGLGGSSTLSIAIIGALASWARDSQSIDPAQDGESFIEIVRDVESAVISVPAGLQDYYGAMYGGLQALYWGPGTHRRECLPLSLLTELENRLLLFYSGKPRNSGINNWNMFKGFIDQNKSGEKEVRAKFEKISAATHLLTHAIYKQQWVEAGQAIADEWATRKTLAPGITTPEIDAAFEAAQSLAPVSGKICGAGGGGCFFVYLPDPDVPNLKQQIITIFKAERIQHLPFRAVPHGLEVVVTCE